MEWQILLGLPLETMETTDTKQRIVCLSLGIQSYLLSGDVFDTVS